MPAFASASSAAPAVSVIVPTYQRPGLVVRAVSDALAQTTADLEVVVVDDGQDDATVRVVRGMGDARVRLVSPPGNLGNAGARNAGIEAARGRWVALLDDDDGWMPDKLSAQLAVGEALLAAGQAAPVVSCRLVAQNETRRFVWPRRLPAAGQPVSEYLFCRRWPSTGDGMVQTSTILAPRALFHAVPFDEGLTRYVDLDWTLRAALAPGFALAFAGEAPLVRWSIDEDRARISNEADWRFDRAWIDARRHLVTPRAHAAFLLTLASIRARRAGDRGATWTLLREALRTGPVSLGEVAFHLANAGLPALARRRLAGGAAVGPAGIRRAREPHGPDDASSP